jgi:two-component system, OmpR family, alkaline phosphatase synthesis response regulator PhoP
MRTSVQTNILLVTSRKDQYNQFSSDCLQEGYSLFYASRIAEALHLLSDRLPDLIILDLYQLEINGLEFCHVVKSTLPAKEVPLIVIAPGNTDDLEIASFDAGADDFIRFPMNPRSFMHRLQTRIKGRKKSFSLRTMLNGKDQMKIDRESFTVIFNNEEIQLSNKEFELLFLMASQPGKVFTREEIFLKVWNKNGQEKDRSIDVHILRLRRKLGKDLISTQKGVGYRFRAS